jgi:hypothetical protein
MESKDRALFTKKFNTFLKKYAHCYPEEAVEFMKENFDSGLTSVCQADILMQINQELGVTYPVPSFYEAHLHKIMENFDIGCNIVEVACGRIPALGNLIAPRQLKIGKGTITLYDPNLLPIKPKYSNMTLHREGFSTTTDISSADLLISTLGCYTMEDTIEAACVNHKDFYVAMCGCTHFKYILPWMIPSPEFYQDTVIDLAERLLKQYDNGHLVVDKLDDDYIIDYPILYNRR